MVLPRGNSIFHEIQPMKRLFTLIVLITLSTMIMAQPTQLPGKFVHSVYFWLKNPDNSTDREAFLQSLTSFIANSKYVSSYHIAPSAGTNRDVVDNSYTYNLVCTFESKEVQDLYQNEDVHLKFIDEASHLWERVQVYDSYPGMQLPAVYTRGDIQIGVVVSDLERSVNFYTNVLGMVEAGGFSIDDDFGRRSGLSGGKPFDVVILKTSDSPSAAEFKLMSFSNGKVPRAGQYIQDDIGMQYITLFVNDMNGVVERLKAAGVEFLGETPVSLDDGRRFVLIKDPNGIFVELIGP